MKISTRQEVDRPAAEVFAALSDYAYFEEILRARGVEIARVRDGDADGLGTAWEAGTTIRGHAISVRTEVTEFARNERIVSETRGGGLEATAEFAVESTGPGRSRLRIGIEVRPVSLAGRMLLQPLKLAKATISERLDRRVAEFARMVERGR